MEHNKYTHLSENQRYKLEMNIKLIEKETHSSIFEVIEGPTPKGWAIINIKLKLTTHQQKELGSLIGCSYKTVGRELFRGIIFFDDYNPRTYRLCKTAKYSYLQAQYRYDNKMKTKGVARTKISQNPELKEIIETLAKEGNETKDRMLNQSLKGIAGRMKSLNYEIRVCSTTMYKYIRLGLLDKWLLKFPYKKAKGKWKYGKRQNGTSIEERESIINQRLTFGHWEIDLIESCNRYCYLFTAYERKTRKGMAIKIPNKTSETIIGVVKFLQHKRIWIFGVNVLSITTDNGSEFWGWKEFALDINNKFNIPVYFCHPYCSHEKGGVENFNKEIRVIIKKKQDISLLNQKEISKIVDSINNKFRGILGYKTAFEMYNECVQTISN